MIKRTPGNLVTREPIDNHAIGRRFLVPSFFRIINRHYLFRLCARGGAAFALAYTTQRLGGIFGDTHNLFDRWNVSFLARVTSAVDNFLAPPPLEWLVAYSLASSETGRIFRRYCSEISSTVASLKKGNSYKAFRLMLSSFEVFSPWVSSLA